MTKCTSITASLTTTPLHQIGECPEQPPSRNKGVSGNREGKQLILSNSMKVLFFFQVMLYEYMHSLVGYRKSLLTFLNTHFFSTNPTHHYFSV